MLPAEPQLVGWYGGSNLAAEPSPAFQFYPKDFLTDGQVASMTLDELGAYMKLLCLCWLDQSLPDEPRRLAVMVGTSPDHFAALWPQLRPCFVVREDGRLTQPRLDRERLKQAEFRAEQALKGAKGGAERARRAAAQARSLSSQSQAGACENSSRSQAGVKPLLEKAQAEVKPESSRGQAESKPESSSPISNLQYYPPTPLQGAVVTDDVVGRIAGEFLESYPEVYARCRHGATMLMREARDFPTAIELVTTWPDVAHLTNMLRLFLMKKDWASKNEPGTIRQFAHMAPQCDALLKAARTA